MYNKVLMLLMKKKMKIMVLGTKLYIEKMVDYTFMLDKTNIKVSLNQKIGLVDFTLTVSKKFHHQEHKI